MRFYGFYSVSASVLMNIRRVAVRLQITCFVFNT